MTIPPSLNQVLLIPISSASAKSAWRDLLIFHSLTETVLILIRMLIILPSQGSMQYIAMVRIYHLNTIQLSLVILLYSAMVLVVQYLKSQ